MSIPIQDCSAAAQRMKGKTLKRLLNVDPNPGLSMWTVYQGARDIKRHRFCARRFVVIESGVSVTDELLVSDELAEIRREMRARGLTCLARRPDDQPHIVEVWL